jgi:hypothetical protein
MEIVVVEDLVCVAAAQAQSGGQEGGVACLFGRDLSGYDYVSVSKDGIMPISVKPTNITRLASISMQ